MDLALIIVPPVLALLLVLWALRNLARHNWLALPEASAQVASAGHLTSRDFAFARVAAQEVMVVNQHMVAANLAAVEAHFHSEASNEVDKALELYTDDVVWEAPARKLMFKGKRAVADNYRKMFAVIRDVEFRNLQRFATEDRVVDDSIVTFTLTGPGFLPLTAGQKVEMRLVHIFEMRDGRISKEIGYEMWRPA